MRNNYSIFYSRLIPHYSTTGTFSREMLVNFGDSKEASRAGPGADALHHVVHGIRPNVVIPRAFWYLQYSKKRWSERTVTLVYSETFCQIKYAIHNPAETYLWPSTVEQVETANLFFNPGRVLPLENKRYNATTLISTGDPPGCVALHCARVADGRRQFSSVFMRRVAV